MRIFLYFDKNPIKSKTYKHIYTHSKYIERCTHLITQLHISYILIFPDISIQFCIQSIQHRIKLHTIDKHMLCKCVNCYNMLWNYINSNIWHVGVDIISYCYYTWHVPMSLFVHVLHMGEDSISMSQATKVAEQCHGVISVEYKSQKMRLHCARTCSIDALCREIGKDCKNGDKYIHSVNVCDFPDWVIIICSHCCQQSSFFWLLWQLVIGHYIESWRNLVKTCTFTPCSPHPVAWGRSLFTNLTDSPHRTPLKACTML